MKIFVLGYPSAIGGANTELWHTVKLWRRAGWDVCLMPTPASPDSPEWRRRLDAIGAATYGDLQPGRQPLHRVSDLAGRPVVSFCDPWFWACHAELKAFGCRTVWVGCMTELSLTERAMPRVAADRYVFQSKYQWDRLEDALLDRHCGPWRSALIRGAFFPDPLPANAAAKPEGTFTIGRLSRPDPRKFAPDLWETYGRCLHPGLRARVMGVDDAVLRRIGPPPSWAEVLPAGAEPSNVFLSRLDALVVCGGEAAENWPRVGLEAMAAGVPIVADRRGGWCEQIEHGVTGLLCDGPDEIAQWTNRLARSPALRAQIAGQARHALRTLADPQRLIHQWAEVFQ